jgi:hypothetical protein
LVGPTLHASCGHCREECARPGIICLSPLPELQRRRPCGYDIVTIANCNGAVICVAKVLSLPSAGVIALVTMVLSLTPRWYWVACHCPRREGPVALLRRRHVPPLMLFTFALARLSSAGRLCCAWWRQLLWRLLHCCLQCAGALAHVALASSSIPCCARREGHEGLMLPHRHCRATIASPHQCCIVAAVVTLPSCCCHTVTVAPLLRLHRVAVAL